MSGHEIDGDIAESNGLPPASPGSTFTAERGNQLRLSDVLGEGRVGEDVRRDAQRIAARLTLRRRRSAGQHRGHAAPRSARFDGFGDELDLERTVELLAERRPLRAEELWVLRPHRHRRSVVLLADVSGSMDGDKARITAAAIGALSGELIDDELTVIAFWKDLAVLRTRATKIDPLPLIDELLRVEPRGLTNVHGAIELATRELARSPLERRCIVLLSDCVHNAGPDPVWAARAAPTLHVMLHENGEHDRPLARRLARAGGGGVRTIRGVDDVAPALAELLSD